MENTQKRPKTNKRGKKKKASAITQSSQPQSLGVVVLPNASKKLTLLKAINPAKVGVLFKYQTSGLLNNAGGFISSVGFNANGLYDVDPRVASTSVPGFTEWMGLYNRYRVLATKYKISLCSRDGITLPFLGCIAWHSVGIGVNGYTENLFSNSLNKRFLVPINPGLAGSVYTDRKMAHDVLGDVNCYTDQNTSGTNASNPLTGWYCTIAFSSISGGAMVNGCFVDIEFEFETELFERRNLSS